jgi:hypothetical protein
VQNYSFPVNKSIPADILILFSLSPGQKRSASVAFPTEIRTFTLTFDHNFTDYEL